MANVIKLRKGLDINLKGSAKKVRGQAGEAEEFALVPDNFTGVSPKVVVHVGDHVNAGEALFVNKNCPEVKFDYPPLTQGRIVISSAQLFGLNANLYRADAQSQPNYQFLLDSLASKDTTHHTPLDLAIRSLVIRRGQVAYRQRDVAAQNGVYSAEYLHLSDLSLHTSLDSL